MKTEVELQRIMFVVNDIPRCLFDLADSKSNISQIRQIQPKLFSYIADVNELNLEGDEKPFAAIALRLAYGQALEALFAMVFAALQCPQSVVGWLLSYRTKDVSELVKKINDTKGILSRVILEEHSWPGILKAIHKPFTPNDPEAADRILKNVIKTWTHFARDFTNPIRSDEYNSIKHGLRSSHGSSMISATLKLPGKDEGTQELNLGGAGHGSHFYSVEKPEGDKLHFTLRHRSMNWHPDNMVASLHIISHSIRNIQTYMLFNCGVREGLDFGWPSEDEIYTRATKLRHGLLNIDFDQGIEFLPEHRVTKEEILASYKSVSSPVDSNTNAPQ